MERKKAIRSAYRLTGSSSFYDGMMTCPHAAGQAGVPSGLGYGQADVQRVSGKSPVRHPGGFFRAAAFTFRARAGGQTGSSGAHMNR